MESRRMSFSCTKCPYSTKRSYNLKRYITKDHTADRSRKLEDGLPKRRRIQKPEDGMYTEEKYEKTRDTLDRTKQLRIGLHRRHPRAEPEDGLYTEEDIGWMKLWILYMLGFHL